MAAHEQALQDLLHQSLPLYAYMKLQVLKASNGTFQCKVPLQPANANHFGSVHAALQWAASEAVGGLVYFTAFPEESPLLPVVKNFYIDFKRPAMTDLVAETTYSEQQLQRMRHQCLAEGYFNFELDISLTDIHGDSVATSHGVYAIRKISR